MNLNTLKEFRYGVYTCFGNAKNALFNLVDALCSQADARSFPELSLSPFFERTWASLYEALEDGQIDAERLRQIFVDFAPLPEAGEMVFLGVDTSNLYRPGPPSRLCRWTITCIAGFICCALPIRKPSWSPPTHLLLV